MNSLPLHAAGHHLDGSGRSVLDRVVSSYTYSVRGLAYARRGGSGRTRSALVVAMPDTPGASPLSSAMDEVSDVVALLRDTEVLVSSGATRTAVLKSLPHHSIAHFACHAVGDPVNAGLGRLLLHDHDSSALTVEALSRLDLGHVELAFLSACHTSETAEWLADEAVHITAAFHLAGCRNVVGTITPVNSTAARITAAVYDHLTSGGSTESRLSDIALALHHAVRLVRETFPAAPTTWAASVHVGT
ncbi:CHAT domain-containing protein [Actinosynnema sp. NPDC059797]